MGRGVVVEVGRVEHGEDTVERIRVVEGRGKIERGSKEREKEGAGGGRGEGAGERMATSMLEKHRVALRARIYHRVRAGSFFRGQRKDEIAGARKKSSKRTSFYSRERHKAGDIRASELSLFPALSSSLLFQLRKTLFSAGGRRVLRFDRPEIPGSSPELPRR